MNIFLLRHAETETNRDGALATGSADSLTQHGHDQAQRIIGSLLELEIECTLCSPYPRALQTIQPFAEVPKIEIEVHPCLAEGQLSLTDAPIREEPKYSRHVSDHDYPHENESPGVFMERVVQAKKLIDTQPHSSLLVVTLGHMLRELLNSMLALPHKTRFPHDNCGLSHVSVGDVNMVSYINRPIFSNQ